MPKAPDHGVDMLQSIWIRTKFRQALVGVLGILEDVIYVLLSLFFFVAALYVMIDTIIHADWHSVSSLVATTLDHFLLVLMLAELLHTLLLFVRTHQFRHQPFLVVGIIAAIRRILVITAQAATGHEILASGYLWDLGITTLVVLVLSVALKISPKEDGF